MRLIKFMMAMEIYCGKKIINKLGRRIPSLLGKEGIFVIFIKELLLLSPS